MMPSHTKPTFYLCFLFQALHRHKFHQQFFCMDLLFLAIESSGDYIFAKSSLKITEYYSLYLFLGICIANFRDGIRLEFAYRPWHFDSVPKVAYGLSIQIISPQPTNFTPTRHSYRRHRYFLEWISFCNEDCYGYAKWHTWTWNVLYTFAFLLAAKALPW